MREAYNNFVFYKEWLEQLAIVAIGGDSKDLVSLFDGLADFLEGNDPENLTPMAQLVFNQISAQIIRDKEHLKETTSSRSESGKKGAEVRWGKTNDSKGMASDSKPMANDGKEWQTIANDGHKEEVERDLKSEFEIVWSKYPRKVGRKDAYRHYKAARKKGTTFDEVYNGVLKYAEAMQGQDEQYIAHGSAWFNGHRWEDDVSPHKPRPHNPTMAELHQLPIIDPFAELRGAT